MITGVTMEEVMVGTMVVMMEVEISKCYHLPPASSKECYGFPMDLMV
jgi:hypothetical protein